MPNITVVPGLELDDDMYERVLAKIGQCAPDEVADFTWDRFVARESWTLIPDVNDPNEPWYKAGLTVKCAPPYEQTLLLWLYAAPDLRGPKLSDGTRQHMPHNFPWPCTVHALLGGYVEAVYQVERPELVDVDPYSNHNLGEVFERQIRCGQDEFDRPGYTTTSFHEITEIYAPGRTMLLLDCGLGRKNGWGYLDPATGEYTPNQQSDFAARFKQLLRDRNPHLRRG